jgi:hypothetical protein
MSFWAKLRKLLGREADEARDVAEDLERRINADLDRRERELNATPEERLDLAIDDAARADAEFDEIARRIGNEPGSPAEPD